MDKWFFITSVLNREMTSKSILLGLDESSSYLQPYIKFQEVYLIYASTVEISIGIVVLLSVTEESSSREPGVGGRSAPPRR